MVRSVTRLAVPRVEGARRLDRQDEHALDRATRAAQFTRGLNSSTVALMQ